MGRAKGGIPKLTTPIASTGRRAREMRDGFSPALVRDRALLRQTEKLANMDRDKQEQYRQMRAGDERNVALEYGHRWTEVCGPDIGHGRHG